MTLQKNLDRAAGIKFPVQAIIDGEIMGAGKEFNKKNAEKLAAEKACEALAI